MRTLTRHFVLMGGLWLLPFLVNSTAGDYVHFKGVAAAAAEKKKETRKVPAMREKTYKVLSQALLLIDPEAAQHEDGKAVEPVKANPKEAINVLLKLLESRGMNSYETAQVWNALAMAYYMHWSWARCGTCSSFTTSRRTIPRPWSTWIVCWP
jgi:hypothetical protein